MKKLLIFLSLISSNAFALDPKIYLGAEIQQNAMTLSTNSVALNNATIKPNAKDYYETTKTNLGIFAGFELNKNFAAELNYSQFDTIKNNNNTGLVFISNGSPIDSVSRIKVQNIALDLKPSLVYGALKPYAIVGFNVIRATGTEIFSAVGFSDPTSETKTALGYSIGMGLQYNLTKNFAVRAQAKYTKANVNFSTLTGLKSIDSITTLSAGGLYQF